MTDILARLATIQAAVALLKATFDAAIDNLQAGVDLLIADVAADSRPGMYVTGNTLRRKDGTVIVLRGIESMYGDNAAANPALFVSLQTALGANCIAPLFQTSQSSVPKVLALLEAAKAAGVVVGVNADHITDGRAWLCQPAIVALLNSYDNIFLECEVETGWPQTQAAWVADVNGLVAALRTAGHVHPIKVGSPFGGRYMRHAANAGAQVLAADPLHNVLFTFQAYVSPPSSGSWDYLDEINGIPYLASDPTGCNRLVAAILASGLCFVLGLDKVDDVGETVWQTLATLCNSNGISWQWWVLVNGGDQNALIYPAGGWNYNSVTVNPIGTQVAALLGAP